MTKEELEKKYLIMKENAETLAELLDKEQKKNKEAIQFVEKWKQEDGDGSVFFDINTNPNDLLNILKGEDKE